MTKVVAEIGCNWRNLDEAKEMIAAAKNASAHAVKFQLFNEETIKDSPLEKQLAELILNESQVAELHDCAKKHEILFALTPMYLEAMKIAEKHADIIKIRYKDHENSELLDVALGTGKTVLISVPRPPLGDMRFFNPRLYTCYCVPRYPPDPEDFNLDLACICHGFSSHYPHTILDIAFAINRTYEDSYIEKHVMLGIGYRAYFTNLNTLKPDDGKPLEIAFREPPIDAAVSISFSELKNLISNLKIIDRIQRTRLS